MGGVGWSVQTAMWCIIGTAHTPVPRFGSLEIGDGACQLDVIKHPKICCLLLKDDLMGPPWLSHSPLECKLSQMHKHMAPT